MIKATSTIASSTVLMVACAANSPPDLSLEGAIYDRVRELALACYSEQRNLSELFGQHAVWTACRSFAESTARRQVPFMHTR